jgi:hypothetical protein
MLRGVGREKDHLDLGLSELRGQLVGVVALGAVEKKDSLPLISCIASSLFKIRDENVLDRFVESFFRYATVFLMHEHVLVWCIA